MSEVSRDKSRSHLRLIECVSRSDEPVYYSFEDGLRMHFPKGDFGREGVADSKPRLLTVVPILPSSYHRFR